MNKNIKEFLQYMIYGSVVLLTLYLSFNIKYYGFNQEWFDSQSLGFDGVFIWFCLMMGISTGMIKIFRHLFGIENSII
jgi:hypothetical protein